MYYADHITHHNPCHLWHLCHACCMGFVIFVNKTAPSCVYIIRKLGKPNLIHFCSQINFSDIFTITLLGSMFILAHTCYQNPASKWVLTSVHRRHSGISIRGFPILQCVCYVKGKSI